MKFKVISSSMPEPNLLDSVLSFLNEPERITFEPDAFLKVAQAEGTTGFLNVHGYLQDFDNTEIPSDQLGHWVDAVQKFGTLYTSIFPDIHGEATKDMSLHEALHRLITGYEFGNIQARNGLNRAESEDDPRVLHAAFDILTRPTIRGKLGEEILALITQFCGLSLQDHYAVGDFNPKQFDAQSSLERLDHSTHLSLPSSEHSANNQDRVKTGTVFENKGTFTIVCDGVSSCRDEKNVFMTTGRFAAEHVSESLKRFFEAQLILKPHFNPSNPRDLNELRSQCLREMKNICKSFPAFPSLDGYSLTTLEVALVIPEGNHFHVVTLSLGDSQTMVVNPEGECIMMNVPENYVGFSGNVITVLDTQFIEQASINCVRDMSNPNGYIGNNGFYNHETLNTCSISSLKVDSGSKVITGSDGFFDYSDSSDSRERQVDFNDLPHFWALTNALIRCNLNDKELSDTLAALSVIFSSKADDVSVSVQTL